MNVFSAVLPNIQEELKRDTSIKVQPSWLDIAMLPAVRSVVESNINLDATCDSDDLKKKFARVLPSAIKKWSSNTVEELEQFARKQLGLPPLSKPSCFPSVIFRCKVCRHRFGFDEALSHQHLYKERHAGDRPEINCNMTPYDKLLIHHHVHPRNTQVLRVDVTISRRVENLVRRIGQNPSRITYQELRHSTVKVVCGLCRPDVATRMNFEHAVRRIVQFMDDRRTSLILQFEHCLNTHLSKNETEVWTRVSAREQNVTSSAGTA